MSMNISERAHKEHLLMYHDKCFQKDPGFIFAAFSHQQIKTTTLGGFLLADSGKIDEILEHFLSLDQQTLQDIVNRLSEGEVVNLSIKEESDCFHILKDLDHIGGKICGSITSKKYMRNEVWSLTVYMGVPVWYITISPADSKHPVCLYFAGLDTTFKPMIPNQDERLHLVASNPVTCA